MNIYCFSTLSFAKLQFKSVINKAFHKHGVASFTDAWIETMIARTAKALALSHLLQMRGLKQGIITDINVKTSRIFYRCVDWNNREGETPEETDSRIFYRCVDWNSCYVRIKYYICVASFTDAWIETIFEKLHCCNHLSHLLQMRGLKQDKKGRYQYLFQSHLLQMRGLKLQFAPACSLTNCRIFYRCVDWNIRPSVKRYEQEVASFTDAWIETVSWRHCEKTFGRIFYRCVDWNTYTALGAATNHSRIFYRCVDWNL